MSVGGSSSETVSPRHIINNQSLWSLCNNKDCIYNTSFLSHTSPGIIIL
jgi:hypothetical protein